MKTSQADFEGSDFFSDFLKTWTAAGFSKSKIKKLVCLGLGNFAQSQHLSSQVSAKNQLLFVLCLQKHFEIHHQVLVFDPILTDSEKDILEGLNLCSRITNQEGHYQYPELTFYFLPHCPKQLLNNLLWSNWHQLHNLVIVGNSITNLVLNLTKTQLAEIHLIEASCQFLTEKPIKNSFQFKDIFNNLSLHCFQTTEEKLPEISLEKPKYSQDCEFIIQKNGN